MGRGTHESGSADGQRMTAHTEVSMYRIAIVDDSEINLTLLSALVKKLDSC